MTHLRQREHGKHHGLPVRGAGVDGPGLGEQGDGAHGEADPDHVLPHAVGEHAFAGRARRARHYAFFRRFGGERQAGQAVGDQVDPQDVNW